LIDMPATYQHKDETVLCPFFNHLSTFSFDRAKDLIEKEKECCVKGVSSRWTQFVSVLVQLCTAERLYVNLTFLQPRSFLRKDSSLRGVLESMTAEVERLLDVNEAVETEDIVSNVAQDISILFKGRLKTMEVYDRLSNFSKFPNYVSLQAIVRSVSITRKDVHSESLESYKEVYFLEVGLLYECISMCVSLQSWEFYSSTTHLQAISEKLNRWTELIQNRETRKLSFASSLLRGVGGQADPHLYLWFTKFRAALLSKFSLYFYQVLANQTTGGEMRALTSKLPVDQSNRLISFHRRTDAATTCIVFDATGVQGYRGPGYHIQADKKESGPTGMDLFPSIFSHPCHPGALWPNVVMILTNKDEELNQDRTVYFYDSGVGITYFLQRIEPRYCIVVLLEGRRLERDSTINTFLQETALQLRLNKILTSLKPGSK